MVEIALKLKSAILAKKSQSISIAALKKIRIEVLNVAMLMSIAALIAVYFFMNNDVAMANYQKASLQKSIENLKMEIHNLNLELTNKRSIGYLKNAAESMGLVANETIQYVKITGPVANR